MMISKSIYFKNFKIKKKNTKKKIIKKFLKNLILDKNDFNKSLNTSYKKNYEFKNFKNKLNLRLIGMGGSILGAKAIHQFLSHKIKRKAQFIDNLTTNNYKNKKKIINVVISKSGNTLETLLNASIILKKNDTNIFISEKKNNEITLLAKKFRSEVIEHNNFIGGRYSVLSETGMLPAELMGLNPNKFRQLNNIIKNENFFNALIENINSLFLLSKNKSNMILLNYNSELESFLEWYKQLVAESLGKKKKGFLPIISNIPKDNHSIMQYYLDGVQNNFFTFFSLNNEKGAKLKSSNLSNNYKFLKNLPVGKILNIQRMSTKNVFIKKKIPFRCFEILKKNEETLGELFIFFMFETILLGKILNLNPYDQPSVELIKKETKNFFTLI